LGSGTSRKFRSLLILQTRSTIRSFSSCSSSVFFPRKIRGKHFFLSFERLRAQRSVSFSSLRSGNMVRLLSGFELSDLSCLERSE
jgi:hypothetical protein